MNIPIEQLIELRKTIDSGLQGMNSLQNILILMEQWRRDELKSVDQLYKEVTSEEEEDEPRGADPVEVLIDAVLQSAGDVNSGGISLSDLASQAQDFLDDNNARVRNTLVREERANKALAKRVKELEKHIEGLEETAKRYRPDLDVLDEFPKLHFKNVHVIRQLLWELGAGRENKTD